tara:strand:- start:12408 stop:13256 length:849 start_codon:yes stop_codon:yes gene_type:complete
MTIRNILVHADGSEQSVQTIRSARRIAGAFEANLSGFCVLPDVAVAAAVSDGAMANAQLIADMQKAAEDRAATAKEIFRREAGTPDRQGDWTLADATISGAHDAAVATALYADLVVMGRYDGDNSARQDPGLAADIAIESGRPLVLIPSAVGESAFGRKIMIGWKESRESVRAIHDAMPFLARAETVTVATVVDESADDASAESGERIKDMLAGHGIDAVLHVLPAGDDESTSANLIAHAQRSGADMLVAGAYSRSRLREGLFGGVSKSLFDACPLPVLLSH